MMLLMGVTNTLQIILKKMETGHSDPPASNTLYSVATGWIRAIF